MNFVGVMQDDAMGQHKPSNTKSLTMVSPKAIIVFSPICALHPKTNPGRTSQRNEILWMTGYVN